MKHFLGIGPGKAGTTFLYEFFRRHDQVALGSIKETYFFSKNFHLGRQWYEKEKIVGENESKKIFGDIGNQYFKDLSCLDKVLSLYPDSKIIFFKRDEVARLESCYKFELKMGSNISIAEYLQEQELWHFNNDEIYRRILEFFSVDQVYVLNFDMLITSPDEELYRLCNFLGIQKINSSPKMYTNPSVHPRSRTAVACGRFLARTLRYVRAFAMLQSLKNSLVIRKIFFTSDRICISDEERNMIGSFVRLAKNPAG